MDTYPASPQALLSQTGLLPLTDRTRCIRQTGPAEPPRNNGWRVPFPGDKSLRSPAPDALSASFVFVSIALAAGRGKRPEGRPHGSTARNSPARQIVQS